MTEGSEVADTDPSVGEKPREVPSVASFFKWAPGVLLSLYVLGFIAANAFFARFELLKPTLLNGRYLSAGLLCVAFLLVPAAIGFKMVFDFHGWEKETLASKVAFSVLYSSLPVMYGWMLLAFTTIDPGRWRSWFVLSTAVLYGVYMASWLWDTERKRGQLDRFGLLRFAHPTVALATTVVGALMFGTAVYPWVPPQLGGAAVRKGFVALTAEAPAILPRALRNQPVPVVDLDERFLYVIGCPFEDRDTIPAVLMIPIQYVSAAHLESASHQFVAVPEYLSQGWCRPQVWH